MCWSFALLRGFPLQKWPFHLVEGLAAIREPDLIFITDCEAPQRNAGLAAQRKNKESAVVLCISQHFPGIKNESDACSESSWLQLHPCNRHLTHTHAHTKSVCDSEGTSWFRVRPGRRAHKAMGTAGHRREDERSSAEMWRAQGWNWS